MAAKVLILMGSSSDLEVMKEAKAILDEFGVESFMTVASAHRSPERAHKLASTAEAEGYGVVIAGAGMAAHLAGVVAANTVLPVIGVPLSSPPFDGLDSLLSTVQMPGGIPVATVAVGKAGAKNAGYLAVQILATSDPSLREKVRASRKAMADAVEKTAAHLR